MNPGEMYMITLRILKPNIKKYLKRNNQALLEIVNDTGKVTKRIANILKLSKQYDIFCKKEYHQ